MEFEFYDSDRHYWRSVDLLGKGAYGKVYKGRNRETGDVVAIKTFKFVDNIERESNALNRLRHKNIVNFIGVEKCQSRSGPSKVLVLELCSGGSLHHLLEKPENGFGLTDDVFLRVINDIASGMSYLYNDAKFVHKDLKPQNILIYIEEDGSPVYKLSDFGTARLLERDEEFQSIGGTEEYLHPDIYNRCFFGTKTSFSASVDLWSIGITLYKIATGKFPFGPLNNHETMMRIYLEKPSGFISGYEQEIEGDNNSSVDSINNVNFNKMGINYFTNMELACNNKKITYKNELPDDCNLSLALRKLVEPIIANLLETKKELISFDNFFKSVSSLVEKCHMNVFDTRRGKTFVIYYNPEDFHETIINLVEHNTPSDVVKNGSYLLIYDNIYLKKYISEGMEIRKNNINDNTININLDQAATKIELIESNKLAVSIKEKVKIEYKKSFSNKNIEFISSIKNKNIEKENPVYLFSENNGDSETSCARNTFYDTPLEESGRKINYLFVRQCSQSVCFIEKTIKNFRIWQKSLTEAARCYFKKLKEDKDSLNLNLGKLNSSIDSFDKLLNTIYLYVHSINALKHDHCQSKFFEKDKDSNGQLTKIDSLEVKSLNMQKELFAENKNELEEINIMFKEIANQIKNLEISMIDLTNDCRACEKCEAKINILSNQIKEICNSLQPYAKDKASVMFKVEEKNISRICHKSKNLVNEHCQKNYCALYNRFHGWLKDAYNISTNLHNLRNNRIQVLEEKIQILSSNFDKMECKRWKYLKDIIPLQDHFRDKVQLKKDLLQYFIEKNSKLSSNIFDMLENNCRMLEEINLSKINFGNFIQDGVIKFKKGNTIGVSSSKS